MIVAPVVSGRKGEQADLFTELRARASCAVRRWTASMNSTRAGLDKNRRHNDRCGGRPPQRCARTCAGAWPESFETALTHAEGRAIAVEMDTGTEHLFSAKFACPVCGFALPNWNRGCSRSTTRWAPAPLRRPRQVEFFDPDRVVDPPRPVPGLRRHPQLGPPQPVLLPALASLADHYQFDIDKPFEACRADPPRGAARLRARQDRLPLSRRRRQTGAQRSTPSKASSQPRAPLLRNRLRRRARGARQTANCPCPSLPRHRLRTEARFVLIGERNLSRSQPPAAGPLPRLLRRPQHHRPARPGGRKIVSEISSRLQFLINVGLDYLSLDRSADTPSPAAKPSASACQPDRLRPHRRDVRARRALHRPAPARQRPPPRNPAPARHGQHGDRRRGTTRTPSGWPTMVDMGPGAGEHGGGHRPKASPQERRRPPGLPAPTSSGTRFIAVPATPRRRPERVLRIEGATGNNLKNVT